MFAKRTAMWTALAFTVVALIFAFNGGVEVFLPMLLLAAVPGAIALSKHIRDLGLIEQNKQIQENAAKQPKASPPKTSEGNRIFLPTPLPKVIDLYPFDRPVVSGWVGYSTPHPGIASPSHGVNLESVNGANNTSIEHPSSASTIPAKQQGVPNRGESGSESPQSTPSEHSGQTSAPDRRVQMRACGQCRTNNTHGGKFCEQCGYELTNSPVPLRTQPDSNPSPSRLFTSDASRLPTSQTPQKRANAPSELIGLISKMNMPGVREAAAKPNRQADPLLMWGPDRFPQVIAWVRNNLRMQGVIASDEEVEQAFRQFVHEIYQQHLNQMSATSAPRNPARPGRNR